MQPHTATVWRLKVCRNFGGNVCVMWVRWQCGPCETHLPARSPSSCSLYKSSSAPFWMEMQIFLCHNADGCLQQKERTGGNKGVERVEEEEEEEELCRHLLSICSVCLSAICMQLLSTFCSLHTGSGDALWIYTLLINLLHSEGNHRPLTGLERDTMPSSVQQKNCSSCRCCFLSCDSKNVNATITCPDYDCIINLMLVITDCFIK